MGESLDVRSLSDDRLYDLFAAADDNGDEQLCQLCIDEIVRRCNLSPAVVHEVPAPLLRLPKAFWHTKPEGEGRG